MPTHPAADRFNELALRRPELAALEKPFLKAYTLLESCLKRGNQIFLCGNGGSAADCEHWAGELLKGFYSRRSLPPAVKAALRPELRVLQGGLPAIPLTGFISLRTAVANDVDPRLEFAQLVWALGKKGDVLIAISTSGMAANVCFAVEAATYRGLKVLGLSGSAGGQLRDLTDCCLLMPATRTHLIQEMHLAVYHTLCLALEDRFFPNEKPTRSRRSTATSS